MKPEIIVIKRDGREKLFERGRIEHAVKLAMSDVNYRSARLPHKVSKFVENYIISSDKTRNDSINTGIMIDIKDIEGLVISHLEDIAPEVSKAYKSYRTSRSDERELNDDLMKEIKQLGASTNRDK